MTKFELRQAMLFGSNNLEHEILVTYFLFAEYWGWTPKQVDELDVDVVLALRYMLTEMIKEREKEREAALTKHDKRILRGAVI